MTERKGLSEKAVVELARKNHIPIEGMLPALEAEVSGEVATAENLKVPYRIGLTLLRSMGFSSRFFREIRDKGLFFAARCPACGHSVFPPQRPVCHRCIKEGAYREYEYVELGPQVEGTVVSWSKLVRGSSKHVGKGILYPAVIRVDGAHNAHWQYVLPKEGLDMHVGSRVRSVLLPQEARTGEISDYAFELFA